MSDCPNSFFICPNVWKYDCSIAIKMDDRRENSGSSWDIRVRECRELFNFIRIISIHHFVSCVHSYKVAPVVKSLFVMSRSFFNSIHHMTDLGSSLGPSLIVSNITKFDEILSLNILYKNYISKRKVANKPKLLIGKMNENEQLEMKNDCYSLSNDEIIYYLRVSDVWTIIFSFTKQPSLLCYILVYFCRSSNPWFISLIF